MAASESSKVLLVGRHAAWGQRAADHLNRQGLDTDWVTEVVQAVSRVRADPAVSTVVLAEDHDKDGLLSGISRMAMARPELLMVVLAEDYDASAMVRYLQLGQREAGHSRVRYLQNDYDFDRLAMMIRTDFSALTADVPIHVGV